MPVNPNDIVRVVARMSRSQADDYINVYHFKYTGAAAEADATFMTNIAAFLDLRYTTINGDIGSNVDYDIIEGVNVTQVSLLPDTAWPVLTVGGGAGVVLPNQNAACVFWRTLRPKTRTAKFIPPYIQTTNLGNGTLTVAAIALLQTYGDAFVGPLTSGTTTFEYGAFNKVAVRFTPVVAAIVAITFRTQRRRRVGVGS